MNISGVLVHARPQRAAAVRERLLALPGTEVHAVADDGRIVVTVEDESEGIVADTLLQIQGLDDVLSAAMVYHYFDSNEEGEGSHETDKA